MQYFSVVIPLYNKSKYIKRCLESVASQTYPYYEIIVVNDGSTDDSELKVRALNMPSVKLITQTNQGVSVARNTGVANSKYDYVAFLDADDIWSKDFLLELNNLINKYPKAGIYGLNHFLSYANGKIVFEDYSWLFHGEKDGILPDYFKVFAQLGKSPFSNSGCCYPKHVFNEVGGYCPKIKVTEDSDLWCRIALRYEIAFYINPVATYYLETPNNTRTIIEFEDYKVSRTLQELVISKDISIKHLKSVKKLISFQQISLVKRAILTGNRKFALKKLIDKRILKYYPFQVFILVVAALLPYTVFKAIHKFK